MTAPTETVVRIASSKMFESLMDCFPDIVQSVDPNGRIVYVNRKAMELLGYTHDELIGMPIEKLYAPEILEKVRQGFATLQHDGSLTVCESLLQTKSGSRITVEIRSFAVYDDAGVFVRTFSILRDIREVKELQNSLIHTSRLAAIGELSACVAHDISNPLSVIKLYSELLEMQLKDLSSAEPKAMEGLLESLGSMRKSADKMEKLITHLRDFSRSTQTQPELVDLRQVVGDALFMLTNKLDKGNVTVIRRIPDTAVTLMGHGSQLEQVFMNLFSNACDAMRGVADPVLEVEVAVVESGPKRGSWKCVVTDHGAGIAPEHRDQMFMPFFTTKPKGQGTGLGLSIVKNIVRRHGGEISLQSELGVGTSFTMLLPPNAKLGPAGVAAVLANTAALPA